MVFFEMKEQESFTESLRDFHTLISVLCAGTKELAPLSHSTYI